ncbi:MAG: hypothetical protein [Wendovervirus sonii]|uniref:Uncharacterized protein n=1 Tax=phage Lak_Megaphage_Sonny TaxID=3109229 RepID=A0ABZ0Z4W6_9CAUD|nr:MAG: hypothetical protein [phage Lak_Megaphage_Sonny]
MFFIRIDKDITLFDLCEMTDLKLMAASDIYNQPPTMFFNFENSNWMICHNGQRLSVDMSNIMTMMANGDIDHIDLYSENENYKQANNLLTLFEKSKIRAFMVILDDNKIKKFKK